MPKSLKTNTPLNSPRLWNPPAIAQVFLAYVCVPGPLVIDGWIDLPTTTQLSLYREETGSRRSR